METPCSSLVDETRRIISPDGRLAASWSGYEPRSGQILMAEEVARAFQDQDVALVEAGTGTGKTLAYIIPALLSQRKTVVATWTKNLQDQIYHKDLPFVNQALGGDFSFAYLKGRENYLCLYYYRSFLKEPSFSAVGEAVFFEVLKKWAEKTKTGDRAELVDFPDEFFTWSDLTASSDRCLGRKCPDFQDCFLQKARRAAAAADLVVVNHHLFMADLAVREGGFGEVIPNYEAVIFDEAHEIEEVATQHFGVDVSSWRLARLKTDVEKGLVRQKRMNPGFGRLLMALGHQADTWSRKFLKNVEHVTLWEEDHPDFIPLKEHGGQILANLADLESSLEEAAMGEEELDALAKRTGLIQDDLAFLLEGRDSGFVFWAQRRGRGLFLKASPVDVAPFFQQHLFARRIPLVFTSATLTTDGSFKYCKQRLGFSEEVEGLVVDSPFDYDQQSLLYVPRSFPYPSSPDYLPALVEEVERLLHLSQGRAFVLFTSYRNLNHVAAELAGRLPWPCLVQGQAPRSALLDRFRSRTESVLMATQSFWQGVDVPGDSLSAVIIDKLPFPRPDHPLTTARSQRLRDEGTDPFFNLTVPEAIITLKQGLGRLIRTETDRGLLAVLDSRLVRKPYGRKFLASLPGRRLTHLHEDIEAFFSQEPTPA